MNNTETQSRHSVQRLVRRLAYLRRNWMFRTFWDFGIWLDGPLKWKFGKRWLEVEYTGTTFKHFAWAVSDANNWRFKDALEKLGWAIKDIRIVMWHRRRRLASNDQAERQEERRQ